MATFRSLGGGMNLIGENLFSQLTFSNKISFPANGQYFRLGNIVFINYTCRLNTNLVSDDVLISGLPKAKDDTYAVSTGDAEIGVKMLAGGTEITVSTIISQTTPTWIHLIMWYEI